MTMQIKDIEKKLIELRVEIIKMIRNAGSGHSGAAMSAMEILGALYYGQLSDGALMNFDVSKPGWSGQDYLVLSKYTAAPALYAILADCGFFEKSKLNDYRQINSLLQACPAVKIPGVSAAVANVGDGLSVGVGMGLGLKADKKNNRVFVLAEDRDLQSGTFWEAAMAAAHYKLDNLTLIVERSGVQMDGVMRSVMDTEPTTEKFEAFGWKVFKVTNGHNLDQLLNVFYKALSVKRRPRVILAKTVCAKGIPFAENKFSYYGSVLSDSEMSEFLKFSERSLANFNK